MSEASSDFKATLNLPKTAFPMKANLSQNEPKYIKNWTEQNTYKKILEKNKQSDSFVMTDGPPYANGKLHIGHALNKILKDIVIKYKNMSGKRSAFIPGWDCHGLPIELNVTKKLGAKRKELTDQKVREICKKEALKWVGVQKEEFIRMGILAEWDKPYLTVNPNYEADEVRVLAKILENGILYRGEKPVYWCPKLQTALAAAEIEYQDHTSTSVYVKFNVTKKFDIFKEFSKPLSYVIWTTTPWTLPANYGISLHPELEYGVYELSSELIIIAKGLQETVEETCELKLNLVKTFKGSELENTTATHPFIERESLVILGDHVTLEAGTGCVHTAPGHGMDDYYVGMKYKLPIFSPVGKAGRYTDELPEFAGKTIWESNPLITEKLESSGHLLFQQQITHSYPHNPRTNSPLIFRATPQWFIKMDEESYPLKKKALNAVENDIEFFPAWGKKRLNAMVGNSPDWCVSRQRIWGVPIPVFYCKSCDHALAEPKLMNHIADLMENTGKGLEAYHDTPTEELTKDYKCSECGKNEFTKGSDILDVWFDSGVCHTAVQKRREDLSFPADVYLEGSDQHRGWFQTSLNSSLAAYGEAPFKSLITHGFVNDKKGNKMSKSKGNVIAPQDIIKKYGAEILRLWVAYEDYGNDVNISEEMFARISETYRRIRNTMRFLMGNLEDFDHKTDKVALKDMPLLDQWALASLNELTTKVTRYYEEYDFYKAYHALNNFYTVTLSATYLDVLKDRLYTWDKQGVHRKASQTVFFEIYTHLTKMMAPILSFLGEEIYTYFPDDLKKESIFLESFPKPNKDWDQAEVMKTFATLLDVRSEVSKVLEPMRKDKLIGSSLDAEITITGPSETIDLLKNYQGSQTLDHLKELFIVSDVKLETSENKEVTVTAEKSTGDKCPRCWHYSKNLVKVETYIDVCPKCAEAL